MPSRSIDREDTGDEMVCGPLAKDEAGNTVGPAGYGQKH